MLCFESRRRLFAHRLLIASFSPLAIFSLYNSIRVSCISLAMLLIRRSNLPSTFRTVSSTISSSFFSSFVEGFTDIYRHASLSTLFITSVSARVSLATIRSWVFISSLNLPFIVSELLFEYHLTTTSSNSSSLQ